MKDKKDLTNQFFDLNHFPAQEGIIFFGISMSKISNSQDAKNCFNSIEHLVKKIVKPQVGLNIIYSDYLYFNSDEKASVLKNKYLSLILSHKNNFLKILSKNPWYIQKSFSFITWNQLLLEIKDWTSYLGEVKKIYAKDKKFQKYLLEDLKLIGKKKADENELNFFLEEILLFYLIAKGKVRLHNEYVNGHEKWTLFCYPGKPLKSEIYLFQINPFKLKNSKNKFENSYYDLEEKKLYDYTRVDLENLKF